MKNFVTLKVLIDNLLIYKWDELRSKISSKTWDGQIYEKRASVMAPSLLLANDQDGQS